MSERYQDLLKQTLEISPGKSPDGLTVFYNRLNSREKKPEDLIEDFLNVRWENSPEGRVAARIWAEELLLKMFPESKNKNEKENGNPTTIVHNGSDINLIKAGVLLGKALYLKGRKANPLEVSNDFYRAAELIDKSEALPSVKFQAMEFYNSLFQK